MPEIDCTNATARRRDSIWATSRLMTRAWMPMPYCTGCCRGTGPCTSGIPRCRRGARRPRTRCRAALPIDGAVGAAGVAGRDRFLDDGLAQVVAHLPVRLRALAVASGTLLSVCDGGRPEFRLVRGLLQKDDDEDVEQDDEDADHGLFRHLAGSAAVLAASNSSRAALTVAITRPCASSARRFRDAFPHTDHAEAGAPEATGTARSSPSIQSSPLAVPVVLDDHH